MIQEKTYYYIKRVAYYAALLIIGLSTSSCGTFNQDDKDLAYLGIDHEIDPAKNFYTYATGSDKGLIDSLLPRENLSREDQVKRISRHLLERGDSLSGINKQLQVFFTRAFDTASINQQGIEPLEDIIEAIVQSHSREQILEIATSLNKYGLNPFYTMYFAQDLKDSDSLIICFSQPVLGLVDKDYYLDNTGKYVALQNKYKDYIQAVFNQMGYNDHNAHQVANDIYELEEKISSRLYSQKYLDNKFSYYHVYYQKGLERLNKDFDWEHIFKTQDIQIPSKCMVKTPDYFRVIDRFITYTDQETLEQYLLFRVVHGMSPYLFGTPRQRYKTFYADTLFPGKQERDWQDEIYKFADHYLHPYLSTYYNKQHPRDATFNAVYFLWQETRNVIESKLTKNNWLSPAAKDEALMKFENLKLLTGYDHHTQDTIPFDTATTFIEMLLQVKKMMFNDNLARYNNHQGFRKLSIPSYTGELEYLENVNAIFLPTGYLLQLNIPTRDSLLYMYTRVGFDMAFKLQEAIMLEGKYYNKDANLQVWWAPGDWNQINSISSKVLQHGRQMHVFDSLSGNKFQDTEILLLSANSLYIMKNQYIGQNMKRNSDLDKFFIYFARHAEKCLESRISSSDNQLSARQIVNFSVYLNHAINEKKAVENDDFPMLYNTWAQ